MRRRDQLSGSRLSVRSVKAFADPGAPGLAEMRGSMNQCRPERVSESMPCAKAVAQSTLIDLHFC